MGISHAPCPHILMLVPLTRKTFEELIPAIATGAQYRYCWGKLPEVLRRALISFGGVLLLTLISVFWDYSWRPFFVIAGIFVGLYWLWAPIAVAGRINLQCRRYKYSGFWKGKVLDVFVTEELVGTEETVNSKGDLVLVENRERRINVEVGDRNGFFTTIQAPLRREDKSIVPGQTALMLVMSSQPDLSTIAKVSDLYIPRLDIWVSDYPYLRRDLFIEISRELRDMQRAQKRRN